MSDTNRAEFPVEALLRAIEVAGELVGQIPCQQMMTIEDCDVAVAQHVRHPERYEKLPRSEWCPRCAALDVLAEAILFERARGAVDI